MKKNKFVVLFALMLFSTGVLVSVTSNEVQADTVSESNVSEKSSKPRLKSIEKDKKGNLYFEIVKSDESNFSKETTMFLGNNNGQSAIKNSYKNGKWFVEKSDFSIFEFSRLIELQSKEKNKNVSEKTIIVSGQWR